jgi:hypothetical protein
MSDDEELIERVRKAQEAFNRGEFDAAIEWAHPEVVFVRAGAQSELTGADALRAWMEPDAFESQSTEPSRYEVTGNRVLVSQRTTSRGTGSGIEIEIEAWSVWTFDESGKVIRLEFFLGHEEEQARRALRAD